MPKITLELTNEQIKQLEKEFNIKAGNNIILGKEIFYINSKGVIVKKQGLDSNHDKSRLSIGNIFSSQSEAETELAKRKALATIKQFMKREGIGKKFANGQKQYTIEYMVNHYHIENLEARYTFNLIGYFETAEDAQKVIDNCKKELDILRQC